jgi:hypothetical protein
MTINSRIAAAAALAVVAAGMSTGPAAAWQGAEHHESGKYGHHRDSGSSRGCFNSGGAHASGAAVGSPGFLSGNVIQVPVNVPVNVCGNSVNVLGLLNGVGGN